MKRKPTSRFFKRLYVNNIFKIASNKQRQEYNNYDTIWRPKLKGTNMRFKDFHFGKT